MIICDAVAILGTGAIPDLLYGSESWTIWTRDRNRLEFLDKGDLRTDEAEEPDLEATL
jgi:hypothetical protein